MTANNGITVHESFEQGTPAWFEARAGIVTASNVHKLLTPKLGVADNATSRALIYRLAMERLTGHPVDAGATTYAMRRGTELEPYAREHFRLHWLDDGQTLTEAGFITRDHDATDTAPAYRIGYSPDGLIDDDGILEIKCPGPEKFLTWFEESERYYQEHGTPGYVPAEHMAQVQAGMYAAGRSYGVFMAYTPGLAPIVSDVSLSPFWVDAIKAAVQAAETRITSLIDQHRKATAGEPFDQWFDPFEDETAEIEL